MIKVEKFQALWLRTSTRPINISRKFLDDTITSLIGSKISQYFEHHVAPSDFDESTDFLKEIPEKSSQAEKNSHDHDEQINRKTILRLMMWTISWKFLLSTVKANAQRITSIDEIFCSKSSFDKQAAWYGVFLLDEEERNRLSALFM